MDLQQVLKICDEYIFKREEKPRNDPFIIMDEMIEKLRLLNYKVNFVKNITTKLINKFYFDFNMHGFNFDNKAFTTKETYPIQFAYSFDLCN